MMSTRLWTVDRGLWTSPALVKGVVCPIKDSWEDTL
jgi:hypothetical protein